MVGNHRHNEVPPGRAPSRVNLAKLNLARGRRLGRLSGKHLLRDNRRYITSREPKGERRAARSSAQSGHRPGCFGMTAFKGVKQTFRRRPVNFPPSASTIGPTRRMRFARSMRSSPKAEVGFRSRSTCHEFRLCALRVCPLGDYFREMLNFSRQVGRVGG